MSKNTVASLMRKLQSKGLLVYNAPCNSKKKREEFRNSFEGVKAANLELDTLKAEIIRLSEEVNQAGSGINYEL